VFFGASGDLAYKRIFSALQAMARRGRPDCRIIGVAKSGWTLLNSYSASVTENGGGEDPEVFARLVSQLRYVDGDYGDTDTFARLRAELQGCSRPAHYLAIPPACSAPSSVSSPRQTARTMPRPFSRPARQEACDRSCTGPRLY
jgi:glucose-6-phosphate 1-dehydrogenase